MDERACFAPKSVKEAISILSEYGEKAEVIAGGTDLLVKMKSGDAVPDCLINMEGLKELEYILHDDKEGLRIGARTPIHAVAESPLIGDRFKIIAHAARSLGTPMIRRQATIGGNLCNAAPSADMAPALIVLGAQLKIEGSEGQKVMAAEDFFKGPGETSLDRNEILTEIQVPDTTPNSKTVYLKQTRTRGADLAIVGVAAMAIMDDNVIADVKIALGAAAPTPIRAKKAEAILKGNKPDDHLLETCAEAALLESDPIDDIRSSAAYRKKLIKVLVKRALEQITNKVT
jgi:carbon-monoxide dehydrogenase medium subunit